MPEITPNIGLKKPLESETVNISVINDNMDRIDLGLGDLASVPTVAKDAAGAITELFTNVSDGKTVVAAAITDKGVPTAASDAFAVMADNIEAILVGTDTSDATAVAGDIISQKTAYGATGTKLTGSLVMSGNAGDGEVLVGKSYYNTDAKAKRIGSMPDRGNMSFTPGPTTQTIPAGKHGGIGQVAAVFVPSANVLVGTSIAGTAGTMPNKTGITTSYTTLNDITQGKDAKIVSLTDQHPDNSVRLEFIPEKGYYDGVTTTATIRLWGFNPRFVAAGNPLGWISDATNPPLVGSLEQGKKVARGTTSGNNDGSITIIGLGFQPRSIFLQGKVTFVDSYVLAYWDLDLYGSYSGWSTTGHTISNSGRATFPSFAPNASGITISNTLFQSGMTVNYIVFS